MGLFERTLKIDVPFGNLNVALFFNPIERF